MSKKIEVTEYLKLFEQLFDKHLSELKDLYHNKLVKDAADVPALNGYLILVVSFRNNMSPATNAFEDSYRGQLYNEFKSEVGSSKKIALEHVLLRLDTLRKTYMYEDLAYNKSIKHKDFIESDIEGNEIATTKLIFNTKIEAHVAFLSKSYAEFKFLRYISDIINDGKYLNKNDFFAISKAIENIGITEQVEALKPTNDIIQNSGIKWTKSNQTELIQLIYGMLEAELIETKLSREAVIAEFSRFFNFSIKNPSTKISQAISDRKNGYEPKIFDELKGAYLRYENKILGK